MKKLLLVSLIVVCFTLPANAILGIGIGIHGGLGLNYSHDVLNDQLASIQGIPDSLKFEESLTTLGLHVDVGTVPFFDITAFGDYAWKSKDLIGDFKLIRQSSDVKCVWVGNQSVQLFVFFLDAIPA